MSREELYGELFGSLDTVVFEYAEGEGLRRLSPVTDWLLACFGGDEGICERSDFLGFFLDEAREHWAGESAQTAMRSCSWEEGGTHFEALAVAVGELPVLVLQRAGLRFEELAEQVQRSNELALEKSKLNRETQRRVILLDCVVHDLSNPMATVLVNLQYLVKRLPDGPEREAAERTLAQVERQRAMLRSVVGLFSADPGLAGGGDAVADVGEAVRAAVRAQLDGAMLHRVALVAQVSEAAMEVVAEETHLLRAIENLVVNAVRHSPQDGTVVVRVEDEGEEVAIFVEDEGEGVEAKIAKDLFEPFGRGEGGGQAGLGLFFCQRAVERWGGCSGYTPNEPRGARFWMRLRRASP